MKIQPRQLLLDLWRATTAYSYIKDEWQFGGRAEPNSTADAEQLLCLMYPATTGEAYFRLEQPDRTANDIADALLPLGEPIDIPQVILRAVSAFMRRYADDGGAPTFHGGSYLQSASEGQELTPEQRQVDIVDSMSMSITLCLATLSFFREYRRTGIRRPRLIQDIDALEKAASRRLTAAMVGLLRSFSVHSFSPTSAAGETMLRTLGQDALSREQLVAQVLRSLDDIRVDLRTAYTGLAGQEALDNENHLFECGWSWGVVQGAPPVADTDWPDSDQRPGLAVSRPNLYFTLTALDGIVDLFSERTRRLNLLSPSQQALSRTLQLRWEIAQRYWSTVADFGVRRTALEDVPWPPTVRAEGELPINDHYYSLHVAGIVIEELHRRQPGESKITRVAQVLEELAIRGRVTRRASQADAPIAMHVPGLRIRLVESETKPATLVWPVADFVTALLKRTIRLAVLARSADLRQQLLDLADEIWDHASRRMIVEGAGAGLWDNPRGTFEEILPDSDEPSWYFTERIVECLVAVIGLIDAPPVAGNQDISSARTLLNEADHLYHRELLRGALAAGSAMRRELEDIGVQIDRSRSLVGKRPGTAQANLLAVLRRLDALEAARPSLYQTE